MSRVFELRELLCVIMIRWLTLDLCDRAPSPRERLFSAAVCCGGEYAYICLPRIENLRGLSAEALKDGILVLFSALGLVRTQSQQ